MSGLPKKYAKMGFKKGWLAYKRSKGSKRKTKKYEVVNMARRRKGGFRKFYRKAKKGITFGNVTKVLIGAALAAVYEIFVSPMVPLNGMLKNIVELGAGLFIASMPGVPMFFRAFGAALATINAYSLVISYLPSGGSSSSNQTDW